MITVLILLGIIAWLFYFLFIRGEAYPYFLCVGAMWGIAHSLKMYLPFTKQIVMISPPGFIFQYELSLAYLVSFIVCILGLAVIMEKLK